MRKFIVVMSVVIVFLMYGCSSDKNNSGFQGLSNKQAADMNAARSGFDSAKDPPVAADTHFAAGRLNETQGTIQPAIDQYKAALKIDPRHVASLYRLGRVYSTQKMYAEAIDIWNRYIEATNNSAVGFSNLAYCQELSGDAKIAEASYQEGISRDGTNQQCRVNYGLMLTRQGRLDEARAQFAAVLSPAQVHYNIASVFQQQGKKAAARAEYQEAIKVDPNFVDAQTRLAELEKN